MTDEISKILPEEINNLESQNLGIKILNDSTKLLDSFPSFPKEVLKICVNSVKIFGNEVTNASELQNYSLFLLKISSLALFEGFYEEINEVLTLLISTILEKKFPFDNHFPVFILEFFQFCTECTGDFVLLNSTWRLLIKLITHFKYLEKNIDLVFIISKLISVIETNLLSICDEMSSKSFKTNSTLAKFYNSHLMSICKCFPSIYGNEIRENTIKNLFLLSLKIRENCSLMDNYYYRKELHLILNQIDAIISVGYKSKQFQVKQKELFIEFLIHDIPANPFNLYALMLIIRVIIFFIVEFYGIC